MSGLQDRDYRAVSCTAICDIAAYSISDFDADHDSPKGEVNQSGIINCDDVSDIFKHFVDDKEDSSCLKSLRKSRLCKFLCILTSSNPVCNRRTISLCMNIWS